MEAQKRSKIVLQWKYLIPGRVSDGCWLLSPPPTRSTNPPISDCANSMGGSSSAVLWYAEGGMSSPSVRFLSSKVGKSLP